MRCALASPTADPLGYVLLDADASATRVGEMSRRVNRVATLDGSAAVNDGGYSDADRVFDIGWRPMGAEVDAAVARLLVLCSRLVVAVADGVYLAVPERYSPDADVSTLRLLVIRKLS